MQIRIREAERADLLGVLAVYGQPELDAGKLLTLEQAEKIYSVFQQYILSTVFMLPLPGRRSLEPLPS